MYTGCTCAKKKKTNDLPKTSGRVKSSDFKCYLHFIALWSILGFILVSVVAKRIVSFLEKAQNLQDIISKFPFYPGGTDMLENITTCQFPTGYNGNFTNMLIFN